MLKLCENKKREEKIESHVGPAGCREIEYIINSVDGFFSSSLRT